MKTEEDFDKKYKYDQTIRSENYDDGRLETFGADLAMAHTYAKEVPCRLWTMIEGDEGGLYLVPDFHTVNRLYYVVTTEPWEYDDECYEIEAPEENEDEEDET